MNGPEHYKQAERLLADCEVKRYSEDGHPHYEGARGATSDDPLEPYDFSYVMAAQVHATLALAAATIDAAVSSGSRLPYSWREATA